MIPRNVAKQAKRILWAAALILFVSTFVLIATLGSSNTASDGEGHTMLIMFSAIAWCFIGASAVDGLANSTSAPRALLELGSWLGVGIVFSIPIFFARGNGGLGSVTPVLIAGIAVIVGSRLAYFAAFGAREAREAARDAYEELLDEIAERSSATLPTAVDTATTFPSDRPFGPSHEEGDASLPGKPDHPGPSGEPGPPESAPGGLG